MLAAIVVVAILLGILGGYLWWGRRLQRVQTRLHTVLELTRPPLESVLMAVRPAATVDLLTPEGVSAVQGQWHSDDATQPRRRVGDAVGRWYRITAVIPPRVGRIETDGAAVVFEAVVDGYAEIWVNGQLPPANGGALIRGYSAANRVLLTRNARPGERIELAVFGISAPLSDPPPEFFGLRSATLDFFPTRKEQPAGVGEVVRLHPGLDAVVPAGARIEKIADRFEATEGPVWMPGGYLLFSDFGANLIYRWSPDDGVSVFRTKSGYAGSDIGEYRLPGSNGLAVDLDGRLTIAEHGRRRVVRLERSGAVTVVADRHEGRRLNSPNDLVYTRDGTLYFTDPPYGLPGAHADPRRELPYSGVFRWSAGQLQLVNTDLSGPNGLAFSPDERHLYLSNSDPANSGVMRYELGAGGTLTNRSLFSKLPADGLKVDRHGNLYVAGPGGASVISPDGQHLGTIRPPEWLTNLAWGDDDRRTLYMTAQTAVYRIRLEIPGTP